MWLKHHYHSSHLSFLNELQILCNANWCVQLSSTAEVTGKTCDCWSQPISGNVCQYDAQRQRLNMASLSVFFSCSLGVAETVLLLWGRIVLLFFLSPDAPFCTVNSWSHNFGYGRGPVRLCPFYWSWTRTGQRPAGGWAKTTLFPITLSDFIYRSK